MATRSLSLVLRVLRACPRAGVRLLASTMKSSVHICMVFLWPERCRTGHPLFQVQYPPRFSTEDRGMELTKVHISLARTTLV